MLEVGGHRLQRWTEVTSRMYPAYDHDIPSSSAMDIGKLGSGGAITTDTCNPAQKTRRLLVDKVIEAAGEMSTE